MFINKNYSIWLVCFALLGTVSVSMAQDVLDDVAFVASVEEISLTPTHIAPDDFKVWELEDINAGEISQFQLAPQTIGGAIMHKTVAEIWFITAGHGKVWIQGLGEQDVWPGTYFIIPAQTGFQVRNDSTRVLTVLGLTMPQYHPSENVSIEGPWPPTSGE